MVTLIQTIKRIEKYGNITFLVQRTLNGQEHVIANRMPDVFIDLGFSVPIAASVVMVDQAQGGDSMKIVADTHQIEPNIDTQPGDLIVYLRAILRPAHPTRRYTLRDLEKILGHSIELVKE